MKSETRRPKEGRSPKAEAKKSLFGARGQLRPFRISVFGFLSGFGIRPSAFKFRSHPAVTNTHTGALGVRSYEAQGCTLVKRDPPSSKALWRTGKPEWPRA